MKKTLRLISVCVIPGLMLIFINVALAGSPVSKSQASAFARPIGFNPWAGHAPASRSSLQIEPITGLSITHTSPVFADLLTHFTATITGGTSPIGYVWSFGDGPAEPPGTDAVVPHIYVSTGTYTVVLTAFNVVSSVTQTISVTVVEAPYRVHLPLIMKNFMRPVEPSDLVCDLSLNPPAPLAGETFVINVRLRNLEGSSADGFWVDLYMNPITVPNKFNLFPWPVACGEGCPGGIAWGISDTPLAAGNTRTLVSIPKRFHPNGFDPVYSQWTGSLPAGQYNLYAYADSIDNPVPDGISGAVEETNEDNNLCEKLGLIIPSVKTTDQYWRLSNRLPVRPGP
jgi:PKD repeat protein